jgi:hypothetical protein
MGPKSSGVKVTCCIEKNSGPKVLSQGHERQDGKRQSGNKGGEDYLGLVGLRAV